MAQRAIAVQQNEPFPCACHMPCPKLAMCVITFGFALELKMCVALCASWQMRVAHARSIGGAATCHLCMFIYMRAASESMQSGARTGARHCSLCTRARECMHTCTLHTPRPAAVRRASRQPTASQHVSIHQRWDLYRSEHLFNKCCIRTGTVCMGLHAHSRSECRCVRCLHAWSPQHPASRLKF